MIIKRRYCTYGQLYRDVVSKEAIIRIFDRHGVEERIKSTILDPYNDIIVKDTDMGSCIPSDVFQELWDELDILDKTHPFDNGYTYSDVSGVSVVPSRNGNKVMQIMYKSQVEMPNFIVQVIAFEYKDGKTSIIEPW